MATKIQIKRTSVSGRTPNTADPANTSYISAGELAVNLTDEKLYSSNGTVAFEIGANLTNTSISTKLTVGNSTVNTVINSTSVSVKALVANGSAGGSGDVLFSNGVGIYWAPSGALATNVNATYAWTNTHTFSNTVTFNSVVQANGVAGTNGQVLTANATGGVYWANSTGGTVTISKFIYSVASNTTVFEGPDDNTKVLGYTVNKESVYLNGIKLIKGSDYIQSNTTAITLTSNAISGDVIEVVDVVGADSSETFKFTIASNTATITGNDDDSVPFTYIAGYELVYLNGVKLTFASDYTTPNTTHIVLSETAISGDVVEIITFPAQSSTEDLADPVSYGSATTNLLTIDSYNATSYRTAKYLVQANTVDSFHSSEAVLIHDGTTAYISEYGMVYSNGSLYSLSADINAGEVRLRVTPTRSGTTFKSKRIILEV